MGNYVTCAQAIADKSAQATKDAAQDAAIANAAGAGAAAVTPASVLAQVQAMSPAQIAAMCAKLNCAPTAAALTQSLLLLAGSGVVGNVLAISAAGVASWVPDKQTELLASGSGYHVIRHSDGTIVQTGTVVLPPYGGTFALPITFPNAIVSELAMLRTISAVGVDAACSGYSPNTSTMFIGSANPNTQSYSYALIGY